MSKMYEIIESLCKEKGISITKMCNEANVSRGSLTDLKKDRSSELSVANTSKLAAYFNVSTDFLIGKDENDNIKAFDEYGEPLFLDEEVREIVDSLRTRPEMKILFSASKKATKEDIMKTVKIIEALRNGEDE